MEGKRQYLLDGLRGLTLISMILYHGMFDLLEIYGVHVSWFWRLPGIIWQQSICWSFIILSGFCWNLSRNPVKNGLVVSVGKCGDLDLYAGGTNYIWNSDISGKCHAPAGVVEAVA